MSKYIDRTLSVLLILGAGGHTFGSLHVYASQPITLLWSLCATVLVVLLGVLNILRSYKQEEFALGLITVLGTACWLFIAIAFGFLIGNPLDARVAIFAVLSLGLVIFGVRSCFQNRGSLGRREH